MYMQKFSYSGQFIFLEIMPDDAKTVDLETYVSVMLDCILKT